MSPNARTSRVQEVDAGRTAELHASEHPAPPAEGKWRGVLHQVRGLLGRRRGLRRRRARERG